MTNTSISNNFHEFMFHSNLKIIKIERKKYIHHCALLNFFNNCQLISLRRKKPWLP